VKFLAELSSFVLSAVQHVFVGDIHWRNMHYAEKIVVPVVVFRNHRRFHPLRQGGGASTLAAEGNDAAAGPVIDVQIDLGEIETQLRKLLLPEQELLLVSGAHHLHDHHQLSTAVFKALKQDSVYAATQGGGSAAHNANAREQCTGRAMQQWRNSDWKMSLIRILIPFSVCAWLSRLLSLQPRPYLDSKILIGPVRNARLAGNHTYTCAALLTSFLCCILFCICFCVQRSSSMPPTI
jgi:hypothetical protein